jgi:hypothetical protein
MLRLVPLCVTLLLAVSSLPAASQGIGATPIPDDITYGPLPFEPLAECPTGAVVFSPGMNLQDVVDAQPRSATYCFTAGVYENPTIIPRTGDTYVGVEGAVLDGGGVTRSAFSARLEPNPSNPISNVTIRGLSFQNFTDEPTYRDFTSPFAAVEGGPGWIIENSVFQDNMAGLAMGHNWMWADGAVVRNNRFINNSFEGISTNGSNILVEHNELSGNGWALTDEERTWGGGGSKFTDQMIWADTTYTNMIAPERDGDDQLILRYNLVTSNLGNGLWLDIDNQNALIEYNLIEYNYWSGIQDELSTGTTIRHNILRHNRSGNEALGVWGGAEILLVNSQDGVVENNELTVSGNGRGILMIYETYRGEDYLSSNYTVRENTITFLNMPVYRSEDMVQVVTGGRPFAGVTGGDGDAPLYSSGNLYDGNTYYLVDPAANYFLWNGPLNWAGFRGRGMEANGRCFVIDTNQAC